MGKYLKWLLAAIVVMQLVPYGRDHSNPPVSAEPKWDSPETRALFKRACFDCHSNETTWPWYANVAPVSWLVQNDVDGGREHLNFSEWDRAQRHAGDVAFETRNGDMPPWFYLPMHPDAKLSDAEVKALMDGAEKSLGPQEAERRRGNPFK